MQANGGGPYAECAPAGPPGTLIVQLPAGTAEVTVSGLSGTSAAWPDLSVTVIIRGAGESMTILRNGASTPTRLLSVRAGADVTLEALTVEGFDGEPDAGSGGAIYLESSAALTLRDTTFRANEGTSPGAVVCAPFAGTSTRLTIEGSTFENNGSTGGGGVLDLRDVLLSVEGSTFTGNRGTSSNVIRVGTETASRTSTIRDSMFVDNIADGTTAGIRAAGPGAVIVEDTIFSGNQATGNGGVIHSESPLTVRRSTFTENRTTLSMGGTIFVTAAFAVEDSVFTENHSPTSGGAIYTAHGAGLIQRSRFVRNTAADGGAIGHHGAEPLTVEDSVFIDNFTPVTGITIEADPEHASEGGPDGAFVIERASLGTTIHSTAPTTVHGSCFVGGVREIISTAFSGTVDATGNYWTTTDASVQGDSGVDTSSPLSSPPAGCDTGIAAMLGETAIEAVVEGNATPGDDYTPIELPLVFAPGQSDIVVPVVALADAIADPGELVVLNVTYMGAGDSRVVVIDDVMSADVSIVKTADVTTARLGDPVEFTLTVSNAGPGEATGIVVTDALPSGLSLVDASIDAPIGVTASCVAGPPASCTLSSLAAGAMATVTVRTLVSGTSDITNRAEVTSVGDPEPTNDASEVLVEIDGTVDAGPPADDAGASNDDAGTMHIGEDAGAAVDGGTGVQEGGCGCRVVSSSPRSRALFGLLALGLALAARRRPRG